MQKFDMTRNATGKIVSASDVEKYGYCPLSWWLSEQDAVEEESGLRKGNEDHAKIGDDVRNIRDKEKVSLESERNVLWFSLISIVIGVNAVAIIYRVYAPPTQGQAIMILLSIIAVLWVMVAIMFFYFGIKRERAQRRSDDITTTREGKLEDEKAVDLSPSHIDWRKVSKETRWTTIMFFIVSGILTLNGAIILFSWEGVYPKTLSTIFLVLALIWLIGSSFFYYVSQRREFGKRDIDVIDISDAGRPSFTDSELSAILFALVATILASNSLTIYQNPDTNTGRILLIIAIMWLYGGFVFMYITIRANLRLKMIFNWRRSSKKGVVDGSGMNLAQNIEYALEEGSAEYEHSVIWFAAVAMILAINAIVMNFSDSIEDLAGTILAHVFVIVALIWLIGASFFLFLVLRYSKMTSWLRRKHGIGGGAIEYVDAEGDSPKMLVSQRYGLRGRPDYILNRGNYMIPVEVKTGRVPRGPLFSHILQLAAYCLLIEEKYELAPPYGIIRYTNVQHEIDYTEELKGTLTSKLKDMENIIRTGEAHRNHNRPNKCKGCSRRQMCPEKLV